MERLRLATAALHPAAAATARIQADRRRIASVLAGHPHPDSDDLDAEARENAEERMARQEHAARKAAEAEAAAAAACAALTQRGPLAWLRNVALGSLTPAQACLADLADLASRGVGTRPDDDTLRAARERGRLYALAARDRTASWEAQPAVVEAMEQARLNGLVELAAEADDPAVLRALRAGDPDAVRHIIQVREEERRQSIRLSETDELGTSRPPVGPKRPR